MNLNAEKIAIEALTKAEQMEERFDRHIPMLTEEIKNLSKEMHQMELRIMHALALTREQQLKDDRATQWKLIALSGMVATFVSGIGAAISSFVK